MTFNLFEKPVFSFISYEVIINVIAALIMYVISLYSSFNFLNLIGGFVCGSFAITIGFIIIVYCADYVLDKAKEERHAKNISLMFFILRYIIYFIVSGIAIKFLNVNVITLILGLFTIRIIIIVDHFIDKKTGGE